MTITIDLSEDAAESLRDRARRANVPMEDLARAVLEDWLRTPREDSTAAAAYVLHKNAELYRRLA
jgi:antitoxin FitA